MATMTHDERRAVLETLTPEQTQAVRELVEPVLRIVNEPLVPRRYWPKPLTREQVDAWIADHDG